VRLGLPADGVPRPRLPADRALDRRRRGPAPGPRGGRPGPHPRIPAGREARALFRRLGGHRAPVPRLLRLDPRALGDDAGGAPDENWSSFAFIAVATGVALLQLRLVPRAALHHHLPVRPPPVGAQDDHTLIIGYDWAPRGARRSPSRGSAGGAPRATASRATAACSVCPTGIDIRHGLQLECIGCAACIDACDEVMAPSPPEGAHPLRLAKRTRREAHPVAAAAHVRVQRPSAGARRGSPGWSTSRRLAKSSNP
jgi:ferredoxin